MPPRTSRTKIAMWVIPIIDLLLIATAVAVGRGWLLDGAVRRSLERTEPSLETDLAEIARWRASSAQPVDGAPVAIDVPGVRPPAAQAARGIITRLDEIGQAPQVLAAFVDDLVTAELAYWQDQVQRLAGTCVDPATLPPPPSHGTARRLGAGLLELARAQRYGAEIARRLDICTTPIPVPITDDDLRFKFGRPNKLEMPPAEQQAALDRIRAEVDKHPDRRWIYIAGHTDYVGGAKANYPLSEGRARFVADIIRRHLDGKQLDGKQLVEGRDYRLYIERRGDAECPQRTQTDDPEYRRACRKIVIRFMHGLREPAVAARAKVSHAP